MDKTCYFKEACCIIDSSVICDNRNKVFQKIVAYTGRGRGVSLLVKLCIVEDLLYTPMPELEEEGRSLFHTVLDLREDSNHFQYKPEPLVIQKVVKN